MALIEREVDPISRIEGHLGVKLTVNDVTGKVEGADVHGNLWRGFENFLIGRQPNDAITFTQRICGVCPVPHATASMFAVEAALGYNDNFVTYSDIDGDGKGVPAKAVHIRNLVYSAEFLMSHITHFYHLAAPSYVQGPAIPPWTPYFAEGNYNSLLSATNHGATATGTAATGGAKGALPLDKAGFSKDLWSAVIKQYVKALRIRRLTFEAGALFAGRMPMVSSFVAGGVTQAHNEDLTARCDKFEALTKEVGTFIAKEYVPVVLALGALYPDWDNIANGGQGYGGGCGNFLSWGAFPDPTTNMLGIKGAYKLGAAAIVEFHVGKNVAGKDPAAASALVQAELTESIAHSRYADYNGEFGGDTGAAYPGAVSRTKPKRDDATKYSWLKAPRLDGNPMEVGPFARVVTNDLYPVDGTMLRDGGLGAVYARYVKSVNGVTGLDPATINADLAVALVREGAAKLHLWDGAAWTRVGNAAAVTGGTADADIDTLDNATIVAAYTGASAFGDPVIVDGAIELVSWIYNLKGGLSTMDRLRGRGLEALYLTTLMIGDFGKTATDITWGTHQGWVGALRGIANSGSATYTPKTPQDGVGFGVSEAPRGALAHFITVEGGKISKYQCVVPTTWNASPKDGAGVLGPMEQAMIGIPHNEFGNATFTAVDGSSVSTESGVEALRVAQSFDPCIACSVH